MSAATTHAAERVTRRMQRAVGIAMMGWALAAGSAVAEDAAPAPAVQSKPLAATLSAGISLTRGNTETLNYSVGFDLAYDPAGPNSLKWTSLLLRGKQNGVRSVDRTSLAFRDQYALSSRAFVFGQVDFLRDTFKHIESLVAPGVGAGYKLVETSAAQLSLDGGAAVVSEKNTNFDTRTGGALTAGQQLVWNVTSAATIRQSTTHLWKTAAFGDQLHTLSLGLATKVSERIQVTIDALDTYKNRSPDPTTRKNDVAVVAALSAKF